MKTSNFRITVRCALIFLWMTLAASVTVLASEQQLLGVFRPRPSLTLYLDSQGETRTDLILTIHPSKSLTSEMVLVRMFDPKGELTFWRELEMFSGTKPVELRVGVERKGIHQLRIVAGNNQSSVEVSSNRALQYGVSFQNGSFSPWRPDPSALFFYVPPEANQLAFDGGPLEVTSADGDARFRTQSAGGSTSLSWDLPHAGLVLHLQMEPSTEFRAWGFPLILCSSIETAYRFRASTAHLPDGTLLSHPFQKRIAGILPELLDESRVGTSRDLWQPWILPERSGIKNAARETFLFSPYSSLMSVQNALQNQDVDPTSPLGGAILAGESRAHLAPWRSFELPKSCWGGLSPQGAEAEGMAFAALVKSPFNPFFGKTELLYRAAAASLRDLMALGADEVWPQSEITADPYPGFMAFPVGQKNVMAYYFAAPKLPAKVRAIWTESLEHVMDRFYPISFTAARNQSAHFVLAFDQFAAASQVARHVEMARRYSDRFAASASAAGYFMEAGGPDATYSGITHWHLAWAERIFPSDRLLAAIKESYSFWNHTVAPEPTGRILGASDFCHRTAGSFVEEQWGGARGILDDILPEVSAWDLTKPTEVSLEDQLIAAAKNPPTPSFPAITTPRYLYWNTPCAPAPWPALETSSFYRRFGDELVAIKRPAYYAVIYVGKPSLPSITGPQRLVFRRPIASETDPQGKSVSARQIVTFNGGGLSLLWSPGYGSSVLGANWSPLTRHGLQAAHEDGMRYWEDYGSVSAKSDSVEGTLTIKGVMEETALRYERRYRFEKDRISIDLLIIADADLKLSALSEIIPFANGPAKSRGVAISADASQSGDRLASRVRITDQTGAGLGIVFATPQMIVIDPDGPRLGDLSIGNIQIKLPVSMRRGERWMLSYSLQPFSAASQGSSQGAALR